MLTPNTMLTWQGIRATCDWEAQHFDARAFQIEGRPLTPMDLMDAVRVAKPGPVEGEPWWRDCDGPPHLGRTRVVQPPTRQQPPADSVVFCPQAWLEPYRHSVRKWTGPITLVTMCSDEPIHGVAVDQLITRGPMSRWFGVQVTTTHPQLIPMPLGIDQWMAPYFSVARKQPWAERVYRIYVNGRTLGRPERDAAMSYWRERPDATVVPFRPDGPGAYATDLGNAQFVVSPPGIGWDCYRTYEAILMGAIPIVLRRPPTSSVVDGLPVIQVNDWAECTSEFLEREAARCHALTGWEEQLRLDYWVRQIHGNRQGPQGQYQHDHDCRQYAGDLHRGTAAEPATVQR